MPARKYVKTIRSSDGTGKTCSICCLMKPLSEFRKRSKSKDKLAHSCNVCHSSQNAKITRDLKIQVFKHYSGDVPECKCCKEKILVFLTIDHINNDGAAHRKSGIASGSQMYYWLRRNQYPEGFQVLCWNCQHAKAVLDNCPHQTEREKML